MSLQEKKDDRMAEQILNKHMGYDNLASSIKIPVIKAMEEYATIVGAATDAGTELKKEIKRLKRWVSDLQTGMYVNCVYCGHRYGKVNNTPVSMADILKQHIEVCPQHPMSKLKAEINELKDQIVSFCTNVGQLLQSVKVEWEEENCWSDWDEQQMIECINLIRKNSK